MVSLPILAVFRLHFFFIAAIGNYGLVTLALQKIGIDIYSGSFTLFGFSGLVLVYLYFQIPLMIIVVYPALEGIKNEWREAAANLGANKLSYWRYIGIPILTPPVLGSFFSLICKCFCCVCNSKCSNSRNNSVTSASSWNLSQWRCCSRSIKCWLCHGF